MCLVFAIYIGLDHVQLTLLNWYTESVLALKKTESELKFSVFYLPSAKTLLVSKSIAHDLATKYHVSQMLLWFEDKFLTTLQH